VRHVSGKAMATILKARGWVHVRTNGSHFIFRHPDSPNRIDLPIHANKDLAPGTQRDVMRKAGMTDENL